MKTSEMIAMLEKNPALRFERISDEGQASVSAGCIILPQGSVMLCSDWQLVREPVPAWEAIKALTEGKTIKCEMNAFDSFYLSPEKVERGGMEFDMSWIKTGKWYIEEA